MSFRNDLDSDTLLSLENDPLAFCILALTSLLVPPGLCDELITRPEESYRLWCVVVCDLETSRMGAPYIYDISSLRVDDLTLILLT